MYFLYLLYMFQRMYVFYCILICNQTNTVNRDIEMLPFAC
jgi:hypothetical protein